jgi:tetratricopeptide (TPR) repeat protein
MTDIGELEEYLKAHPADHEQRWRLAKKLYRACEYERALEHLNIVRDEWFRKLNVLRYAAATHYRLGQHDEAVQVLEQAVADWPREIGVREQLARVLEVAGRRQQALDVWAAVLEIDPKHALARQSLRRLRSASDSPESDIVESDSGIDLTSGWTCSNCGASNGEEFERCWQCHASASETRTPTPKPIRKVAHPSSPWVSTLVTGLALVAFLCWGLFLFLVHLTALASGPERVLADGTVKEALDVHFFIPRGVTALALLLAWPLALKASLALWKAPRVPGANVTIAGLLFAACFYVVSWASPSMLLYALLVPAVLSLMVIVGTFRIGFRKAVGVWATQLTVTAGLLAASFLFFVGTAPVDERMAILSFTQIHDGQNPSSKHTLGSVHPPAVLALQWDSSGSPWLDDVVGGAVFEVIYPPAQPPLTLKLRENGQEVLSSQSEATPFRFPYRVRPGNQYELAITARKAIDVSITVFSILHPRPR